MNVVDLGDVGRWTKPQTHDTKRPSILGCWKYWSARLPRGPLEYDRGASQLISREAGLAYPIRDGIPIMLPEEARKLE